MVGEALHAWVLSSDIVCAPTAAITPWPEAPVVGAYGATVRASERTREREAQLVQDQEPIDAIVRIGFESEQKMREALATEEYQRAHGLRVAYMRDTSVGIYSAVLDRRVQLV